MPRKRRCCPPGLPVHVVQRGNNRQACFFSDDDYRDYLNWLLQGSREFNIAMHAWVLMNNHVHLLMTPDSNDGVSEFMQWLGRLYVRRFNDRHERTGTLFDGRFKSSVIQDKEYLLACQRYIELNPVRAKMVEDPAEYPWSSYAANALGEEIELCTPHEEFLAIGSGKKRRCLVYKKYVSEAISRSELKAFRKGIMAGKPIARFEVNLPNLL